MAVVALATGMSDSLLDRLYTKQAAMGTYMSAKQLDSRKDIV